MKTFSKTLLLTAMAASLAACGGDEKTTSATTQTQNKVSKADISANIQGTVFDALTRKPISEDAKLKVQFVVGNSYRAATVQTSDDNLSDYSISNLPASIVSGNTTIRVRIQAEGYHTLNAKTKITLDCYSSDVCQNGVIDDVLHEVTNYKLWPTSVASQAAEIKVTYKGKAVPNALVYLNHKQLGNTALLSQGYDIDYLSVEPVTTDANGIAKFDGSKLAIGGEYTAYVYPTDIGGVKTGLSSKVVNTGYAPTGSSSTSLYELKLKDAYTVGDTEGLYVINRSNGNENNVDANGVLKIKLSRPITLISQANMTYSANPVDNDTDTSGAGTTVSAALDSLKAVVSLSADKKEISITPSWANNAAPSNATFKTVTIDHKDLNGKISFTLEGGKILYTLEDLTLPDGTKGLADVNVGDNMKVIAKQN